MERDEIKGLTQQAFTAMMAWAADPDGFEMTQSQIATYVPGPEGEIKLINGFVNLAGLLLDELEQKQSAKECRFCKTSLGGGTASTRAPLGV